MCKNFPWNRYTENSETFTIIKKGTSQSSCDVDNLLDQCRKVREHLDKTKQRFLPGLLGLSIILRQPGVEDLWSLDILASKSVLVCVVREVDQLSYSFLNSVMWRKKGESETKNMKGGICLFMIGTEPRRATYFVFNSVSW